jgi:hypothetical protein
MSTLNDFKSRADAFEATHALFTLQLKGRPFWDYIRPYVFREIAVASGLSRRVIWPNQQLPKSVLWRTATSFSQTTIELGRRLIAPAEKHYDIVFFDYDTKRIVNDRRVNCVTYPTVKTLSERYSLLVLDPSDFNESTDGLYPCDVYSIRADYLIARTLARLLPLSNQELAFLADLGRRIEQEFRVTVDIVEFVREIFLYQHLLCERLKQKLRAWSPSLIVFQNDGTRYAVQAARDLGIGVLEMQHGATFRGDFFTSYGDNVKIQTMPDDILTFGTYWNHSFSTAARKTAVGFPFFESSLRTINRKAIQRQPGLIIGVSTLEQALPACLFEVAKSRPNIRIRFKLRPEEYSTWRSIYPKEMALQPNFQFIADDQVPLFEHLSAAQYIVATACTTAIYEGLCLGASPLIYGTSCLEMMEDLVADGFALQVFNPEDILRIIDANKSGKPAHSDLFYKPDALKNIELAFASLMPHQALT